MLVEEALNHYILGEKWIKRILESSEMGATAVFLALEGEAAVTGDEKSALQEESNNKSPFNWYHAY